ncbi:MAG: TlpA family protein disulfide reductase [Solirubrobacteraceae bacterium]
MSDGRCRWLVGIVAVLAIGYVAFGGDRTSGPGARGLPPGAQLPPFAVPLAQSGVDCDEPQDPCDANVARRAGEGSAGSRPACEVRGPGVLNLCELAERGPLVLAFLAARGGDCADGLDRLDRVAARHPGVQVAAVGIRGDLGELRAIVRRHRWRFAVGWDRDGILANLYGVAVCPHITYARWHGRAQSTSLGTVGERELERRIDAAVAASRRAGWRPSEG